jgi:hypothetical protein
LKKENFSQKAQKKPNFCMGTIEGFSLEPRFLRGLFLSFEKFKPKKLFLEIAFFY